MCKTTTLALFIIIVAAGTAIALIASPVSATQQGQSFIARLTGNAEVPPNDSNATAIFHQKFIARLTGNAEVPPKDTNAKGIFLMDLSPDGRIKNYVLNVTNITDVTAAHIHQGVKDISGPILLTLYKSVSPTKVVNGTLSKGQILGSHYEGPFKGKYNSDLMMLINKGKAYVNIHTKQNPQGEIRGQILNASSAS
jgi:hypothetical protein